MSTSSARPRPLALDLDGTLVDPRPRQLAALAEVIDAEPRTGPLDLDEVWRLKRGGRTTGEALIELGVARPVAADLAARWVDTVEEPRWLRLDRPLPGVTATLRALAGSAGGAAIITARRHPDRVRAQLVSLGLEELCEEIRVVSPQAAVAEKAAQLGKLGCRGFVGDTESDAAAAGLAGVAFAAVGTGQRSPEFLAARWLPVFDSLGEAVASL